MLNRNLDIYIKDSTKNFTEINEPRKQLLAEVAEYIRVKATTNKTINLTFICTHNSRRSHTGQLWAQAAAYYYGIPNVNCFSAGTEATAFNPRAVMALQKAGFDISSESNSENPLYKVIFGTDFKTTTAFSKTITNKANPQQDFAAIMTCNNADEACPIVIGADARFPVKYEDPKVADDTPEEETKYNERCRQISIEMLYMFSLVK